MISAPDKKSFPKTPDGTVDWETVFEDANDGLIPLLSHAQTPDALRQITIVIIEKLYTRKGDESEVEGFKKQLDRITFEGDNVEEQVRVLRSSVTDLLRTIKKDRISKAQAYIKLKKEEEAAAKQGKKRKKRRIKHADRRSDLRSKSVGAIDNTTKAVLWLFAIFMAGIVLAGGVYFVLELLPKQSRERPRPTIEDFRANQPQPQVSPEIEEEPEPEPEPEESVAEPEEEDVEEAPPPRAIVALRIVMWPMNQTDRKHRRRAIKTLIQLNDDYSTADGCRLGPRLVDIVNNDLQRAYEHVGEPSEQALRVAAATSVKRINEYIGEPLVRTIVHVQNPPKSLNTHYSHKTCSTPTEVAQEYFQE